MAKYRWYYKVKPEYDGKKVLTPKREYTEIIQNELITFEKACRENIPEKYLERVYVPVESVYWFFGVRYSTLYPYEYKE